LSSAILYGAIVVIWAGVLIPRWLRRESSSEETTETTEPIAAPDDAPAATTEPESPERRSRSEQRPRDRRDEQQPLRRDPEDRARVIGARRRLLGMLLALAIGSGALAITKLAAWWVVLPPVVMLAGYLALLREASRADAERRATQPARRRTAPVQAPAAPPVPVVAASEAEIIDITGRVDKEFYDQYTDAKLRAVGD
jgi:hypothetical protein